MASLWRRPFAVPRAFWAIADQCAVSGGNFLTNLILVRTLRPAEFGTYSLVLSAVIFLNNLQQALISYPLCVTGASAQPRPFRMIVGFALFCTGLVAIFAFSPLLLASGMWLGRLPELLAAAAALLLWQLQDTLRTAFTAKLEQRRALLGDALSYLGQALLIGAICFRTRPSVSSIFLIIATTSFVALLIQSLQLKPLRFGRMVFSAHLQEFWQLGRWNVIAKVVGFFTLQAIPWFIVLRHGKIQVAGFQALFQFMAFTNPLLFSMGSMITAKIARDGTYRTRSVARNLLLVMGTVGAYLLALATAGPGIMKLLYGSHSPYLPYASLLPIFAAAWLFEMFALLISSMLGGLREARAVFLLQLAGAVTAILVALPLAYIKGLQAAILGLILVNAVRTAVGLALLLRHGRTGGEPGPAFPSIQQASADVTDRTGVLAAVRNLIPGVRT